MELLGKDKAELSALCAKLGHSAFRGKQIADWLYKKAVRDISEMANLPASLREQLSSGCTLARAEIVKESKALDGTSKFLLKLSDDHTIETVLLPYEDRVSVCVSTQVGCAAGCAFCATADGGFARNLTAGEIVDQVLTLQQVGGRRVSHVVFMGMGEPLLNLDSVVTAIRVLNEELGISMRHITVSTVGITPAMHQLAKLDLPITLALSLHAPDDNLRYALIPLAKKYPLPDVVRAAREYADQTKRRVTFEYLMIAGINDSPEHARALAHLLKGIMGHVNLIPYNEVGGKEFKRPDKDTILRFKTVLESAGIEVTQRMERGQDVSAACGQLKRSTQQNK